MNTISLTNEEMELITGGDTTSTAIDYAGAAVAVAAVVVIVAGAPLIVSCAVASIGLHVAFAACAQHWLF